MTAARSDLMALAGELRDISSHTKTLHYKVISLRLDKVASALRDAAGCGADTKSNGEKQILAPVGEPPIGTTFTIEHDGFTGTVQGYYTTREGKKGVNLQQIGTRVVHVYGEKWLKAPVVTPSDPCPDVREALGESSQTLEYLRREARTWGKIFSVNVDHVLDKNRKALSALTRPLGGFVQGSIATKRSSDPEGSSRTETAGDAG